MKIAFKLRTNRAGIGMRVSSRRSVNRENGGLILPRGNRMEATCKIYPELSDEHAIIDKIARFGKKTKLNNCI